MVDSSHGEKNKKYINMSEQEITEFRNTLGKNYINVHMWENHDIDDISRVTYNYNDNGTIKGNVFAKEKCVGDFVAFGYDAIKNEFPKIKIIIQQDIIHGYEEYIADIANAIFSEQADKKPNDLRVYYPYETKKIYEDLMSDPNRKLAFGSEISSGFNGDSYFTYTDTTKMRSDWREIANITEKQRNEREEFLAYALSERGGLTEVAVASAEDYTNENFTHGFRLIKIDEKEGKIVPYDVKIFDTREDAIKEISESDNLLEVSYEDIIKKQGDKEIMENTENTNVSTQTNEENSHGDNGDTTKTVSQKVGRDSLSPQTKDRQERVNELRNKIKDGVESVRNEENYKAWLKTRSQNFVNKYSFNNIMLVAIQKPDASTVMGYEQWKDYGRQIKAGAKAVNILVPMFYQEKSEGNLCRDICAKLSSQLQKSNTASYRLPNTNLVFEVEKGSPKIKMSLNGKEWTLNNRSELNAFLQKNVIGKTPRYFNPQNVFDVKDTYQPSFLSMKRGFTANEVVKGKGENVPITNDDGKILAKANWSKDPDAPKGYEWVDKSEIGKGTWEMVTAPDGEPVENKKGEYLVINTPERKAKFVETLEMKEVMSKDPKNLKLLFDAVKAVSEDKGVPVKIVSKDSDEWGVSKEANGYYHRATGIEQAQYPKGYIVIPSELMNENMAHAVKTLLHESAHADLHGNIAKLEKEMGQPVSRPMKETQAESVAFMACESFGIDSSDYSFKYLATWANDTELKDFTDSLIVIDREAKQLVDEVNAKLDEMGYTRDFKELPKEPLSNDALNMSQYVTSLNELNATVTNMTNKVDSIVNGINATKSPSNQDKAEIVSSMKVTISKINEEIVKQAKLIPQLDNAQTRVAQNDAILKIESSSKRVNDLMRNYNSLENSLKTISIRNKEGLHEQFLVNSLSTLNKMSKDYSALKDLSLAQKQYIAKSPYIKETFAPLLNDSPDKFVSEVVGRATDAMRVASKTGMFVEISECKATTEPPVFKGGELSHPKVADKIIGEAEKQIRAIKGKVDFFPNTETTLTIFRTTEKHNISCYVANLKIGDGTQLGLSDYLHKVCPQKKELVDTFDKAVREQGAKDKIVGLDFSHRENESDRNVAELANENSTEKGVTMEVAMREIKGQRERNESESTPNVQAVQNEEKGKNSKSRERE